MSAELKPHLRLEIAYVLFIDIVGYSKLLIDEQKAREKDLAIEQIATVERVPNYLTYGFLKLRPEWDSLRGDPRFEKIVASLAPKE